MSIARRGRPKSSIIPELMEEGKLGNGTYKCQYCLRLFPRMKSLNAHTRIHTGKVWQIIHFLKCILHNLVCKTKSVKDYFCSI